MEVSALGSKWTGFSFVSIRFRTGFRRVYCKGFIRVGSAGFGTVTRLDEVEVFRAREYRGVGFQVTGCDSSNGSGFKL